MDNTSILMGSNEPLIKKVKGITSATKREFGMLAKPFLIEDLRKKRGWENKKIAL